MGQGEREREYTVSCIQIRFWKFIIIINIGVEAIHLSETKLMYNASGSLVPLIFVRYLVGNEHLVNIFLNFYRIVWVLSINGTVLHRSITLYTIDL